MGCEGCRELRAEVQKLTLQLKRKRNGSDRIYHDHGVECKFDWDDNQWVGRYEGEEVGRHRSISGLRAIARKWRFEHAPLAAFPERNQNRWAGNTKEYKYAGVVIQKKEHVWHLDGEPVEGFSSLREIRERLRYEALGKEPVEKDRKVQRPPNTDVTDIKGVKVYRRRGIKGSSADVWVCQSPGRSVNGGFTRSWSVRKYGEEAARKHAMKFRRQYLKRKGLI